MGFQGKMRTYEAATGRIFLAIFSDTMLWTDLHSGCNDTVVVLLCRYRYDFVLHCHRSLPDE